jgi:hypothetical protein
MHECGGRRRRSQQAMQVLIRLESVLPRDPGTAGHLVDSALLFVDLSLINCYSFMHVCENKKDGYECWLFSIVNCIVDREPCSGV